MPSPARSVRPPALSASRALAALALLLLGACAAPGTVTYTCTYEDTDEDGSVTEGVYASDTMDCEDYCRVGDQIIGGAWHACDLEDPGPGATRACSCDAVPTDRCRDWLAGRECND